MSGRKRSPSRHRQPALAPAALAALLAGCTFGAQAGSATKASALPAEVEFGRLFHSAAERAQLDHPPPPSRPAPPAAPTVRIDAIVRHPGGAVTVWLDDHPVALPPALRARISPSLELVLPSARLRAGDLWPLSATELSVLRRHLPADRLPPALAHPRERGRQR